MQFYRIADAANPDEHVIASLAVQPALPSGNGEGVRQ